MSTTKEQYNDLKMRSLIAGHIQKPFTRRCYNSRSDSTCNFLLLCKLIVRRESEYEHLDEFPSTTPRDISENLEMAASNRK